MKKTAFIISIALLTMACEKEIIETKNLSDTENGSPQVEFQKDVNSNSDIPSIGDPVVNPDDIKSSEANQ
jgi:hypothetical protein